MIYSLNHNTPYTHSRFTARPTLLLIHSGKIKIKDSKRFLKKFLENQKIKEFCGIVKLKQEKKAPFASFAFGGTKAKVGGTKAKQRQSPGQSKMTLTFPSFQSKELLCWRFDLAFFNLQGFFLNMLKALHVCWFFVRNHKRIVFVSTNGRLQEGIRSAMDSLLQRFPREQLPRLISNRQPAGVLKQPQVKHKKKKSPAVVEHSSFLGTLATLLRRSAKPSKRVGTDRQKWLRDKHFVNNHAYHKLNGLLVKAASRRPTISYGEVHTTFFSNTKKLFQDKFNHLNYDHGGNLTPTHHLKQVPLDLNAPGLSSSAQPFSKYLGRRYGARRQSKSRQSNLGIFLRSALNENSQASKVGKTARIQEKNISRSLRLKKVKPSTLLPLLPLEAQKQRLEAQKQRLGAQKQRQKQLKSPISQSQRQSSVFRKWWKPCGHYAFLMNIYAHHSMKRLASNTHLNQADLVFFTNPDRNLGLVNQIKKLGIPSIGIVSGLKTSAYRKFPSHSCLHDSVTYPIIGNPDSSHFVLMVLRIFTLFIYRLQGRPASPRLKSKARNNSLIAGC